MEQSVSARVCLQLVVKERSARKHHTLQYMPRVTYPARCLSRKHLYTSTIIVLRCHESLAGPGHANVTCHVSPAATCPESLPAPAARRGKHDGSHKRVLRELQIRVWVATKILVNEYKMYFGRTTGCWLILPHCNSEPFKVFFRVIRITKATWHPITRSAARSPYQVGVRMTNTCPDIKRQN